MDDHVDPLIAACLHRYWPISIEVDHFAREEAKRERDREKRLLEHPDPMDPDRPGEEDE